jgi:hypothetical protein
MPMVPLGLLAEHLCALALVWGWVLAAGFPLAALLRIRLGLPGVALLGLAYWAASLFLFPVPHGLDLAAAVALAGLAAACCRRTRPLGLLLAPLRSRASTILLVGGGAYATVLLGQFVPPGMDASMYATSARLIAENGGLPRTYAPFAPGLPFPAVNLGLPTLAAAAVRCGCSPAAAVLACEQLTFAAFILGTFVLLRLWAARTPAALLAVFAAWTARNAQETVVWGGFPTVAGLALGLFAVRLLIDLGRRPGYRPAVALGLTVAALPLVHGVSAGVWGYTAAPVALVVALRGTRRAGAAVHALAVAAGVAALILLSYRAAGHVRAGEADAAWARAFQAGYAPRGDGWELLLSVPAYVKTGAGSTGVWPGVLALGVLLARKRFRAAAAVAGAALLLCLVVANSRHWVLPLSLVLYPERAVYWATPLAAAATALAWRSLPAGLRASGRLRLALVAALVAAGGFRHAAGYQCYAFHPAISRAEWHALRWSARHLDPATDVVLAGYNTAGSYLPAVAGVATTGWHMHFLAMQEAEAALRHRPLTHRFVTGAEEMETQPRGAAVVFRDEQAAIFRLAAGAGRQEASLH